MGDFHENDLSLKRKIQSVLRSYGIAINENGQIVYQGECQISIKAKAVYLMRHAETIGTKKHQFMGEISDNAHICEDGKMNIMNSAKSIHQFYFDHIIVCSDIPRVLETAIELQKYTHDIPFHYCSDFSGINNGGWEGKTPNDLCNIDYRDYLEREEIKNIFAHSSNGTSWGEVLLSCNNLISHINMYYAGKRILLVSQGSMLQGLKILSHNSSTPWGSYDSKMMFNMATGKQSDSMYGKIVCVYDNNA